MMGAITEIWILSPAQWRYKAAWKSMFGETEKGNKKIFRDTHGYQMNLLAF